MTEPAPGTASPAATLTPAAADLLQPPAAMTVEQAQAKRAELFGKAGFAQRVVSGDSEAVKQWREVTRALRPPVDQSTEEGRQYEQNQSGLAILKAKADLPDEVWDWAAAKGPVSADEKLKAVQAKERLFKDKAWVAKYLDGDRAANSELTRINLVLASRVGTFDEIEAFKAEAAKRLNGKNGGGK
jgi:hypothetical protein